MAKKSKRPLLEAEFDRLLGSTRFKNAGIQERISLMLGVKSFGQLLSDGDVMGIETARVRIGYSAWGLRRLCRERKVAYFTRFGQYFFLKSQIDSVFAASPVKS